MFVRLYKYFSCHKGLLYSLMIVSSAVFLFFALQMHYEEDISKLVPGAQDSESSLAFNSLKVKDKIFLQFPSATPSEVDAFMEGLLERDSTIANSLYKLDGSLVLEALDFAMTHLPSFVPESAYPAFEEAIFEADETMARNYELLMADETGRDTQMITLDPLDLRSRILPLEGLGGGFKVKDGHLYSADGSTLLAFLSPSFSYQNSQASLELVNHIKEQIADSGLEVLVHGAPVTSVDNASTIKGDLLVTIGLSFIIILLVLCISFRSFNVLWQNLLPVGYGTAFALAVLYLVKGSMSLMAFGICAVVLGVAISYCLHILIHHRYVGDIERLLREEARPVCLGCLTTVGAFVGLLFTKSSLLQDFGLFASLALVGSTFFTLVFLPHLLKDGDRRFSQKALRLVNKVNDAPLDRNPWFIGALCIIIAVSLFFAPRVQFDSNLRNLNYESPATIAARERYAAQNQDGLQQRYYAAAGATLDEALENHALLHRSIDSLLADGTATKASDLASVLLIPEAEQAARIAAWNAFWTPEKKASALNAIAKGARKVGLDASLFAPFEGLLDASYEPASLYEACIVPDGLLSNYVEYSGGRYLVFSPVLMEPAKQKAVDDALAAVPHAVVVDPIYYTGNLVELTHRDFNAALLLSSLFVLVVLLLSFRKFWVALLAFMPMTLSWYVVQGIMAIFGLEFNLINIVLSTFIFGIGVDYSIFVMQGLLAGTSSELLGQHKTAIFFSAFALYVVMISLLFAVHPAIRSIGVCSLIGMSATILITYSLLPLLYRYLARRFSR